jgi:hypothetical protein
MRKRGVVCAFLLSPLQLSRVLEQGLPYSKDRGPSLRR